MSEEWGSVYVCVCAGCLICPLGRISAQACLAVTARQPVFLSRTHKQRSAKRERRQAPTPAR